MKDNNPQNAEIKAEQQNSENQMGRPDRPATPNQPDQPTQYYPKTTRGFPKPALILLVLGVTILVITAWSARKDFITATLVLMGFACFIAGIFLLTLKKEAGIDPKIAALTAIPYTQNMSRIFADLGIDGNAHFIHVDPNSGFPAPIMQFNPVADKIPQKLPEDALFYTGEEGGGPGILTIPSGWPLLEMLERDHSLHIPTDDEEGLFEVIKETIMELKIASSISCSRSGDDIIIELQDFQHIEGCMEMAEKSQKCCTMAPCPVCSLIGVILTKELGVNTTIQQIIIEIKQKDLEVSFFVKGF
jgi:hypothetical protein